jgi:outer membrane protein assembly factor BamD (BamD/ComL family)
MNSDRVITAFTSALLLCLLACAPYGAIGPGGPDEVLFERGSAAEQQNRCDVARLTFQTLINTYPDSAYTDRARLALEDPRSACKDWTAFPRCSDYACD